MSLRPRRALLGLIAAAAAFAALPAAALGRRDAQRHAVDTQAGSNPSIKTAITFADSGDTPKTVVVSLAPGLLANGTANPTCTQTTRADRRLSGRYRGRDRQRNGGPDVQRTPFTLSRPRGHGNDFAGFETVAAPLPHLYRVFASHDLRRSAST